MKTGSSTSKMAAWKTSIFSDDRHFGSLPGKEKWPPVSNLVFGKTTLFELALIAPAGLETLGGRLQIKIPKDGVTDKRRISKASPTSPWNRMQRDPFDVKSHR
ncbi:uncharacterized protein LOC144090179 [Stigmatopora argus]